METNNEKRIGEALALRENGLSIDQILLRYPDLSPELRPLFSLEERLVKVGEKISPQEALLSRIIDRSSEKQEAKLVKTFLSFRELRWLYVVPGAVAILLMIGFYGTPRGNEDFSTLSTERAADTFSLEATEETSLKQVAPILPPPTGNIDDTVAAFLQEASEEEFSFVEESTEAAQTFQEDTFFIEGINVIDFNEF